MDNAKHLRSRFDYELERRWKASSPDPHKITTNVVVRIKAIEVCMLVGSQFRNIA